MVKFVQLNLNHCAVAQDLLFQTLVQEKADIAIISEVYKDPNTANWVSDSKGTAAFWSEWGSVKTNARGRALLEAVATLELELANTGAAAKYMKPGKSSIFDLTFIDPRLMGAGYSWAVSDHFTGSDHQALLFTLKKDGEIVRRETKRRRKWDTNTFDHEVFLSILGEHESSGTAGERARLLNQVLTLACDASMAIKADARSHPPVHWWNDDIAGIRRQCLQSIRLQQRAKDRPRFQEYHANYKENCRKLKRAIKDAKKKCWHELCEEVDRDPWGRPYKMVMNKIKPRSGTSPSCPDFLSRVVRHLFLEQQQRATETGLRNFQHTEEVTEAGGSSDKQFGFRRGRSTIDAIGHIMNLATDAIEGSRGTRKMCAIIALDIRNALNTARWEDVMEALERLEVPLYLHKFRVSIVAFADDVALVVTAKSMEEVEYLADSSIEPATDWLKSHGFSLAMEKTEAILIARTKARSSATFLVEGNAIQTADVKRYLGVTLDGKL
ncbi:uncharacterized protein [Hetaerina americana]|uniref:uncharacterized protein n=1 Tax=Hetaerina americana TaxID=62018 RepID=UPI003A7F36EF